MTMLCDKDGMQCTKSTLIRSVWINEHGTKYRLAGKLRIGCGTFIFGDFATMLEAQKFMWAIAKKIEAEDS
jgi:hypothetical protein